MLRLTWNDPVYIYFNLRSTDIDEFQNPIKLNHLSPHCRKTTFLRQFFGRKQFASQKLRHDVPMAKINE